MKLKFWKRSQKKPYEKGYNGTDAYRLPDDVPEFSGSLFFLGWPKNRAAEFFIWKYFFVISFLYMLPSALLIVWGGNHNEVVAGFGFIIFFACGFTHHIWLHMKVDQFSKSE